jgi:hypothetical protein
MLVDNLGNSLVRGRLFGCFLLRQLDSMVCLVTEDQIPFISVSSTFFARADALSTLRTLLVALDSLSVWPVGLVDKGRYTRVA